MPMLKTCSIAYCSFACATLVGCATSIPVLPTASSKSQFEGAAYAGVTVEVEKPSLGGELYRVFQQGATGFVPVGAVRGGVEELATTYCTRKGKVVRLVQETTSPALFLPGNFPRVEWIFECAEAPRRESIPMGEPDRLSQLERLKKLLDSGTLTQTEFEREKARVLGVPQPPPK